jgi:predicted peroxiredoxin
MKHSLLTAFLSFLLLLPLSAQAQADQARVAMVLSTDNPQVAGMALHMAWGMKRMSDANVTVVLGAGSAKFALKKGDSPMFPPKKKNLRALVQDILDQGGKVYVCGLCAFAQKIRKDDLMEGVSIQGGDVIMPLLADPGVKVISF